MKVDARNVNQNHTVILLKEHKTTRAGEDVEKLEAYVLLAGMWEGAAAAGNEVAVLQKAK